MSGFILSASQVAGTISPRRSMGTYTTAVRAVGYEEAWGAA